MPDYLFIALLLPGLISIFWFFELFFSSGENAKAKKHLAFFMLCGAVSFYGGLVFFNGYFKLYGQTYFLVSGFAFAQIPAFYIYLLSLTEKKIRLLKYLQHYTLPLLAALSAKYIHIIFLNVDESALMFMNYYTPENLDNKLNNILLFDLIKRNLFIALGIYYLIMIHRKVKINLQRLMDYYSDTICRNPRWIYVSNVFFLMLIITGGLLFNIRNESALVHMKYLSGLPFIILAGVFWAIGFLGNRQEILMVPEADNFGTEDQLPEELKTMLINKLNLVVNEEKIYLKPDLTLPELAKEIGTNRYYLSKLINTGYGMNFNSFINQYRVDEAAGLIRNMEDNISIHDVALHSGFKCYMSFNRNFKRIMRMTPESYAKGQRG